ncbi:MAG: radical SAM protein [Candidatus Zixiibacteriota bacterium]
MAAIRRKKSSVKTLEGIFLQAARLQRRGLLKRLWRLQAMGRQAIGSELRRRKFQRKNGLPAPTAIAFSPTMRCNLSCTGCYARDYPTDNEVPADVIDRMLSSAEKMGVFLSIITGGEPLMRDGILDVFQRHRRVLFLLITNGTLLDKQAARKISRSGNVVPVVSLEGYREHTDARRGGGVHDQVERAMDYLQREGVVFGFSATVASDNFEILISDRFMDEMAKRGCALGFYTEYVPIGSAAQWELVLRQEEQKRFRKRIQQLRREKPMMLVHLPDDEYWGDNKCRAVINGSVHINAEGYVEACPFAHFASDNIKEKSLDQALRSRFLTELRSSDATVRRGRLGCALVENRELLQGIAAETGAKPTDGSHTRLGG